MKQSIAAFFTSEEIRVIKRALQARRIDKTEEREIQSLASGLHWTERTTYRSPNFRLHGSIEGALTSMLETRIGGNQTSHPDYAIERSALLTLLGIPEDEALDLALNFKAFRHPPSGNLLRLYAGLKALSR